jgi:anthranilate phosphoribosyltransferase
MVFKGESGEVEVKPQADSRLSLLAGDVASELLLPRSLGERVAPVATPAVPALRDLWRGRNPTEDCYAMGAVLGTTAAALLLLRPELEVAAAQAQAHELWQARDVGRLG